MFTAKGATLEQVPFYDKNSRQILASYWWLGFGSTVALRWYDPRLAANSHGSVRWFNGTWDYGYDNLTAEGKALFDLLAEIASEYSYATFELHYAWKWTAEFADRVRINLHPDFADEIIGKLVQAFRTVYNEDLPLEKKGNDKALPRPA